MNEYHLPFAVALIAFCAPLPAMTVLEPDEGVMTSGFFQGTDLVRGYAGDNRPTFRVSNNNPFMTAGAETIYLSFASFDPMAFTEPVSSAILSLTSVDGGFNANASATNPFLVSAHGVSSSPFNSIIDDTNASGTTDWVTFFDDEILTATDSVSVDSFGVINFDVTDLVNDWISGNNGEFTIALTGKNNTSPGDFLHGFSNNTEVSGATFLTVNVPEPSVIGLSALALAVGLTRRSKRSS